MLTSNILRRPHSILSVTSALSRTCISFSRNMATTGKYEWLVIVPDVPGTLEKRLQIREEHLKDIKPRVDGGLTTFGGAMLEEQPVEGQTPKMKGSAMVVVAESREEVVQVMKDDIYARSGVWDVEKAQIMAFRTAIRTAKT